VAKQSIYQSQNSRQRVTM